MAKMTFQFLDVGMGDSTFVIMGEGKNTEIALIDFGVQPFTKFKIGADDAMKYLINTITEISHEREKPVPYLDHLFITHPDQDHYNRIMNLITAEYGGYKLEDLSIGKLTYGGARARYKVDLITDIASYVVDKKSIGNLPDKAHSPISGGIVTPAWSFAKGDIKVYLLSANYPTTKGYLANPRSLCLMFRDQSNNKVILMGDAEKHVEAQIIKNYGTAGFLNAYALKLGHHGSQAGTSPAWIDAVKPKAIFASGDFVWAHPYCNTIKRVEDAHTLASMTDHWVCCGKSGKQYFNVDTKLRVCVNLWYVVKDSPTQEMKDEDGDVETVDEGTTYGVQWALEFDGTVTPAINHTPTSVPA